MATKEEGIGDQQADMYGHDAASSHLMQTYQTTEPRKTGDELYDSYMRTYGNDNPFVTEPDGR